MTKLGTGIEILDQRFDGGFPEGSVITLIAEPTSTAELFLYDLSQTRKTHFFTTTRSESVVRTNMELFDMDLESLEIYDLYSQHEDVESFVSECIENVEGNDNIIFDTASTMVEENPEFIDIINEVYQKSHEKNALTYIYMIKDDNSPLSYDESLLPYISDVVMEMMVDISGEKVENQLAITKLRGEEPPSRTIKLNIGTSISIDTSRDIA
ncbi:MAG: RAD55 family ATPase [Halobacteria archaeon]